MLRFGNRMTVVRVCSFFEERKIVQDNPDLILTTVPLKHHLGIPTVQISLFLNGEDESKVFQMLNYLDKRKYHHDLDVYKRQEYTQWLGRTLNRRLEVLELGAGMEMRELQVIRWPLEKTVFFNNKAHMYRINGEFPQISDEIGDKARAVRENSVEFVEKL